jgi:hypothetical protein
LLITDALAFHTLREYSNRKVWAVSCFHPRSPIARDRGHPQRGLEISPGPAATAPGLDYQTWETSESGVGENEKPLVEVHRFPHLKIEMWATQRYRSSMGHPPKQAAEKVPALDQNRWQVPAGAKARLILWALSARLKSCPVTKPIENEFFRSL